MIFARRSSHTPLTTSRIVLHDPNAISNLVTFQIIHAEPAFQFSFIFRPSVYSSLSSFHPRRTSAPSRTVKKSEIVVLKFGIQILSPLMLFFMERVYRIFERDTRNSRNRKRDRLFRCTCGSRVEISFHAFRLCVRLPMRSAYVYGVCKLQSRDTRTACAWFDFGRNAFSVYRSPPDNHANVENSCQESSAPVVLAMYSLISRIRCIL